MTTSISIRPHILAGHKKFKERSVWLFKLLNISYKVFMKNIKFSPPDITNKEIKEVIKTLKSGWITTGPKTKLFEKRIAAFCGNEMAVCLNSGTAGLELILRLLGIGFGDEVIVPAYTYSASASVINHVGANIVFVDNDKDSFFVDYKQLESKITAKTKAIILVDLAGVPADYSRVYDIINRNSEKFIAKNEIQKIFGRAVLISDSAHSFGAEYEGCKAGNLADFTSFSFHAVKNLTTAEGGAITWKNIEGIDNEALYNKFVMYSLHGQNKDAFQKSKLKSWEYDIDFPAYKYNMTDIMASIGLAQLDRYDDLLKKRRKLINIYNEYLKDCNIQILNHYRADMISSGHLYMIRLLDKGEKYRNEFINKMADFGVPVNVHYKPLPMMTAYKNLGFRIEDFPNSYNIYKNEITLPLHTLLRKKDIMYIIKSFKKVLEK